MTSRIACTRCQSPCEPEDIRCPVCALALAALAGLPSHASAQILRCEECGAALKYSAEHQGMKCAFCGSNLKIERPSDPIEQAEWAVPFRVSPAEAHGALHAWLGRQGFFTPSDLPRAARLESLRPLWWASWLVDAKTLVSWTADSDAGSRRSSWAPHSGQTAMTFERLVVSASRGLTQDETMRLTTHTNVAAAQRGYSEGAGLTVEQFDAQRSVARRVVVSAIEATAGAKLRAGIIPGSRFRNVHLSVLLEALTTRRFLLPAYVMAYRYDGTLYRAIVHGQDARCVFGSVPRSVWKILLVVAGVMALVLALVLIVVLVARGR